MADDTIMDSADVMEAEGIDFDDGEFSDLTATETEDKTTMDFHVQMRGYTMSDFETMVVHAAATQLLGGRTFQGEIKEEAAKIASEKITKELKEATKDVMAMTVAKRGGEAVTLSQMIGMEGKDYLTQMVDSQGKPVERGGFGSRGVSRVQYIVGLYVRDHFSKEITEALNELRADFSREVSAKIDAVVNEERAKIAEFLGYEIEKSR